MKLNIETNEVQTLHLEVSMRELYILKQAMWVFLEMKPNLDGLDERYHPMTGRDTIQGFELTGQTYGIDATDCDNLNEQIKEIVKELEGKA